MSEQPIFACRDLRIEARPHEAEPIPMDVDTAIHSGLIVNELVANSLKYGFPDGRAGRIDVRLTRDDDD